MSLLPLMKTPKSYLTAEQWSTKMTRTYQKRYSTSKNKEATTRQYEACIHNKISYHPDGQPTTWKIYYRDCLTRLRQTPIWGSPDWGSGFRRSPQNIWLWRTVRHDWGNSTGLWEAETPLLESTHRVLGMYARTQGKSSNFIGTCCRPTCWSYRVSWGGRGQLWLTEEMRTRVAEVLGHTHWCELSCRPPHWHQATASGMSQANNNRVGTQPHSSGDRLPKVFPRRESPLNKPWIQPCPLEGQDPALSASGQEPVPPTRKPAQDSQTKPSQQRGDNRRVTAILHLVEWRLQTQKVRQNDVAEEYVADGGRRY